MKLTLPQKNKTQGKYRSDNPTEQLCVIDATQENRDAIKHINKLATEQNSKYRLKVRNRCPKEGVTYGTHGEVSTENATGLGIYIDGSVGEKYKNSYLNTRISELANEKEKYRAYAHDLKRELDKMRYNVRALQNAWDNVFIKAPNLTDVKEV